MDTKRLVRKAAVLRSRGKNNSVFDIEDAADLLDLAASEIERLRLDLTAADRQAEKIEALLEPHVNWETEK